MQRATKMQTHNHGADYDDFTCTPLVDKSVASGRLEDARTSLKTTAEVGADPRLLANLLSEVDYRERLSRERAQ
jgi:hypothetical protein